MTSNTPEISALVVIQAFVNLQCDLEQDPQLIQIRDALNEAMLSRSTLSNGLPKILTSLSEIADERRDGILKNVCSLLENSLALINQKIPC